MDNKVRTTPVVFQGIQAGLRLFRWVVLLLLVIFFVTGLRPVPSGEVGLLLRFGALQGASRTDQVKQPGLVVGLPEPIDELLLVPGSDKEGEVVVDEVWKDIDGLATTDKINPVLEGYCLTGDQNIVQAKLVTKYRVVDPVRFRLRVEQPEGILHDAVLAALTQTVSSWDVDDVLRLQRRSGEAPGSTESLPTMVQRRAQQRLDEVDCGVEITALEFKEIHPPRHVIAEFRDVQNARIEMETQKREAEGFVSGKIPEAQGQSNRLVKEALAYESSLRAEAAAELSVFEQIYEEYQKAPALVRQRIFMETMEEIVQSVGTLRFVSPEMRVIVSPGEDLP